VVELLWSLVALVVSRPAVATWLIERAKRTPYTHICNPTDPTDVYMRRWWLFNPYPRSGEKRRLRWCPISIRVHHILREDRDPHLHDHPWNARTIILRGEYEEEREHGEDFVRIRGDSASLRFGQFHRIYYVDPTQGAVTLFITGRQRGTWGFWVGDRKVPWREYLGLI
jgi:hypothetical protein